MLRRDARIRREYLAKKHHDAQHAKLDAQKAAYKRAAHTDDRKPLPTELRKHADALQDAIQLDDLRASTHADRDSEYFDATLADPKLLVTTSHDPSSRLTAFLKEIKLLFPNCERMSRGGHTMARIVETCRADGFTDLLILQEHRGVPDGLVISHMPYGPTAYFGLENVVMRHDIPDVATISEQYPHIILDNLTTTLGKRVGQILKHLLPVPKPESRRVLSFLNRADLISFRHHTFVRRKGEPELAEVGPRFDLKLYQIKLGTIEQQEVENEWVLRPYMNTASKRRAL